MTAARKGPCRRIASTLALGRLEHERDLLRGRIAGLVPGDDGREHADLLAPGEDLALLGRELEADRHLLPGRRRGRLAAQVHYDLLRRRPRCARGNRRAL